MVPPAKEWCKGQRRDFERVRRKESDLSLCAENNYKVGAACNERDRKKEL